MKVLNFEMIKHPMNWVIVVLMVLIAGIALHLITSYFDGTAKPATT